MTPGCKDRQQECEMACKFDLHISKILGSGKPELYLVVLCRRSTMTSTWAKEQLDNIRVTGTIHKLEKEKKNVWNIKYSDVGLIFEIAMLCSSSTKAIIQLKYATEYIRTCVSSWPCIGTQTCAQVLKPDKIDYSIFVKLCDVKYSTQLLSGHFFDQWVS